MPRPIGWLGAPDGRLAGGESRCAERHPSRLAARVLHPRVARDVTRGVGEEGASRVAEERRERGELGDDEWWERAHAAREIAEHERRGERVVERPMRGVGHDRRVGRKSLQRIRGRRRQQDRCEIGRVEPRRIRGKAVPLEECEVEPHVVADDPGDLAVPAGEGDERGNGLRRRGRPDEIAVVKTGKTGDRGRQRAARIGERDEALADRDRAVGTEADADCADLDDPLRSGVVTGRLEVDRDQLALHAPRSSRRAGGRSSCHPRRVTVSVRLAPHLPHTRACVGTRRPGSSGSASSR